MRFRIMSSPDCSERCRCGISRSSSASAQKVARPSRQSRSRRGAAARVGHKLQDAADQVPEARPAGKVGAPGGDVDAGQHRLAKARIMSGESLDHRAHRHGARRPAPERDDAEGAAMIAAVLHLHEGAGARETVEHVRGGLTHGRNVAHAERCSKLTRSARTASAAESFSELPRTRSTSGIAANIFGSICAAQPLTTIFRPGCSRRARRIACRACAPPRR